jgi:hypothetical protein
MKQIAMILAAPIALSLAACSETTTVEGDEVAADPAMADTGMAPADATTTTEPMPTENGDSVTISEDGVTANVGDSDTRVRADVDGDPSLTVETD